MDRCEIHSHSHYSNARLLDAICKPKDLVKRAIDIGLRGIALTDHECLAASIELNQLAKEMRETNPNFKIILGNEIYLTDTREMGQRYWHFILLAKDAEGHKLLRELSSYSWMNSYYDRGMERVPTLKLELEKKVRSNPGHLIATTACLGGEFSANILEMEKARKIGDTRTAEECKANIINFVLWCKDLFKDDFYFEVAPAASREQIIVNKKIAEMAPQFGVKMVIGSDAHYLKKEDRFVHEAFLNSKGGERETAQFYEYAYLQDEEDIIKNLTPSIVDSYEQMCENSMEIWYKIKWYDLTHPQVIPSVEVKDYPKTDEFIPDFQIKRNQYVGVHVGESFKRPVLISMLSSDDKYERYWVNECLKTLVNKNLYKKEYLDRLEEEADIKKTVGEKLGTNMFSYPITLAHYVDMFWDEGSIVGAGRGSSCSGLNHYLLGVTQLDPLKWNFPFWRYLNKERLELGDIDLDLCPSKRGQIIQKIKEERGKKFLPEIDDLSRKNLGCTMVGTWGTVSTKSAVLVACRGYRSEEYPDGIDNDMSGYIASLIPSERGFLWSLKEVVYGNEEKGRKPVTTFINEVNKYPRLLEIMLGIEGLISQRGIHASGVIMFDEDPYRFGCFMKAPNGELITQYDLHKAEAAGMTKYDFLVTDIQDKILETITLLQEAGKIDPALSIREVYEKYLHPDVLNIEDEEVWKAIQNGDILNLFQFDSQVGSQAAKKIKPKNMTELADANGLMRLMTQEKGAETPMEKYVRYKNNIKLWYQEMKDAHLTEHEIKVIEPYFKSSYGVPPSQEQLMQMLMDKEICEFTLAEANGARRIVGKKQMAKIPELREKIFKQASSAMLGKYIWTYGVGPQLGYSFSVIHALAYSYIAYQTAYLATKFNPIYWNTACLLVNSGSLEEQEKEVVSIYEKEDFENFNYQDLPDRKGKIKEKNTDYGKVAKAIGEITEQGIEVSLANINTSGYGFEPDEEHNRILYGLKAIGGVNNEYIDAIKAGRPYVGIKDFLNRCPLNKTAMINLIKAGAFDEVETTLKDRREIMAYYLLNKYKPKETLNLRNLAGLLKNDLIPKEYELQIRVYNFNNYLKANCRNVESFKLDENCLSFLDRFFPETFDLMSIENNSYFISQKAWKKIYDKQMDAIRNYLKDNQAKVLKEYNEIEFKKVWEDNAAGTTSAWEMDALTFYYGEHELAHINNDKYGITDFNKLESKEVETYLKRGGVEIPIYKLYRIAGTVLAKDDTKSIITLLTTSGVVSVKMSKEHYAKYKKQISQVGADGKKTVIEKSWFKRGRKLIFTGYRRDDQFVVKTYARTAGHSVYLIQEINGTELKITHERAEGTMEDEMAGTA